ncbi:MAG: ABC transporter permease subunit [Halocynthiibacter sp.]
MARGPIAIAAHKNHHREAHWLIPAVVVTALTLGPILVIAFRAQGFGRIGVAEFAALKFTLIQAFLSATICIAFAIPTARALARRQFWGRGAVTILLGAPFILPVIVAVLGLLMIFGRSGVVSAGLMAFGFEPLHIYGLWGVVMAHVFFNLPLATRFLLQAWASVPEENYRLAESLGLDGRDALRQLERPLIKDTVPGVFVLIFLLCLTSFAVVLALGGGPKATTLELAIYEAFQYEFDLGQAAVLALLQFVLCLGVAIVGLKFGLPNVSNRPLLARGVRGLFQSGWSKGLDALLIAAVSGFLILPMAAIFMRGAAEVFSLPSVVWEAALNSLVIAVLSTGGVFLLALPIAYSAGGGLRAVEPIGFFSLAVSPLVVGTGLFIVIFPMAKPQDFALPITALVNGVMVLPFVLRILVPDMRMLRDDYDRLSRALGVRRGTWLRVVAFPRLRPALGFSAGLSMAFSLGDLGIVALFADPDFATLPLMLYRLMAAYKMEAASGAAVLLLMLALLVFWLFDLWGRRNVEA